MARKTHPVSEGLFHFDGRFRRSEYWIASIGLGVVRFVVLIAIGAAGCSSMDVISILRKKKVPFTAFECKVHVESVRDQHPHVFELMEFEYILTGQGINPADVQRAVQLSEEKYCQGIAMLSKTAEIRSKVTIIEE